MVIIEKRIGVMPKPVRGLWVKSACRVRKVGRVSKVSSVHKAIRYTHLPWIWVIISED